MVITSAKHPLILHASMLRADSAYRKKIGRVILFGDKLIHELKLPIERLFYTKEIPDLRAKEYISIPDALLCKMSGLPAPETLAAEIVMPEQGDLHGCRWIVALDGISDPGNVGSLFRSAHALGWDGVWILPSSCDPYNDKALRAAKGATFHIPWRRGEIEDFIRFTEVLPFSVVIADKEGASPSPISSPCILILGSEAMGVSPLLKARYPAISIPMVESSESLNVAAAGAILLYILRS